MSKLYNQVSHYPLLFYSYSGGISLAELLGSLLLYSSTKMVWITTKQRHYIYSYNLQALTYLGFVPEYSSFQVQTWTTELKVTQWICLIC